MIVHPEKYVERFAKAGVSMLSFHLEATLDDTPSVLSLIRSCDMQAGLAFNPDMPVDEVLPYIPLCDFILVMSVFAGFGGQSFIEASYERIRAVKAEIRRTGAPCLVEVDGGVSPSNAKALAEAGADILVAGSSVFKAADPAAAIAAMR